MNAAPRLLTRWVAVLLVAAVVGCGAHGARLEPAPGTAPTQAPASATTPARAATVRATEGRPLVARRCGGCHAVPRPAEMSGRAWLDGLVKMRRRMRLPEAEWDSLAAMAVGDTTAPAGGR